MKELTEIETQRYIRMAFDGLKFFYRYPDAREEFFKDAEHAWKEFLLTYHQLPRDRNSWGDVLDELGENDKKRKRGPFTDLRKKYMKKYQLEHGAVNGINLRFQRLFLGVKTGRLDLELFRR